MSHAEKADPAETARIVAEMISDFRLEFMGRIREDFESELAEIEKQGFDPGRGRGRGPKWADGG